MSKRNVLRQAGSDGPPSFEDSKNRRQRARAAGMNPNYWYAVEYDAAIKKGEAKEVIFWKESIAVFRGMDGQLNAILNRCAHRQLKLTGGEVKGCRMVCPYHGWEYDGQGRVTHIPHDLFGRKMPKFRVHRYPLKVRYGLIWIFPGDPALAESRPLPHIPELEGPDAWPCVPFDNTWTAHHSMIIDNVSDFTHEYLHRAHMPFSDAKLLDMQVEEDRVSLTYDSKIGGGKWMAPFVDQSKVKTDRIDLCYDYPYQWSNTGGKIKHHLFVLPIDERRTRAFFLFYFKALKIPMLPITIPRWVMIPVLKIANKVIFDPLIGEDGWAVEAEQEGYDACYDAPMAEINPAVHEFQKLTIRKWEEHLETAKSQPAVRIEANCDAPA
ncbi:MAG: aromatic ring-hydroxylating dioxygenase subunit alpha [Myxococcales bacterium]|nr:aromatic ring-hydroxylating dioxygenase subunit alpha [Myxococcales bacterium]